MSNRITIKAIERSYPKEKAESDRRYLFWVSFLIRKISFYVTYIFLKFKINAYQASIVSLVAGLISCYFLAFGDYIWKIFGVFLLHLYSVGDCVDGNIARFNKTVSKLGSFIDTLSGYIIFNLVLLGISFGVYFYPESSVLLNYTRLNIKIFPIIGSWVALSYNLTRLISKEYKIIVKLNNEKIAISKKEWFLRQFFGMGGFFLPLLILASLFNFLDLLIVFIGLVNTLALFVIIAKTLRAQLK